MNEYVGYLDVGARPRNPRRGNIESRVAGLENIVKQIGKGVQVLLKQQKAGRQMRQAVAGTRSIFTAISTSAAAGGTAPISQVANTDVPFRYFRFSGSVRGRFTLINGAGQPLFDGIDQILVSDPTAPAVELFIAEGVRLSGNSGLTATWNNDDAALAGFGQVIASPEPFSKL